ncbi:NAD(P)/FAD-dependent oxidoreductase [Nocardioides sp. URHA0032]|uniref:NAD(P)/FAD-dependent oxidoreductase n=1 Tax=Nocardioides sp. URHA0032 TaxID=1380388 RepID=UPI0009DDA683|nr:FAD-binding oxidoreductase [Nocardioides sp. URHA0032]
MGCPLNLTEKDPHWERLSLWHDTVITDWSPRAGLRGDTEADVAIVGAGLTGLWTAYYLAEADPSLRIVVLEAETAGYGASGRNGGWCSALFPASLSTLAGMSDRDGALAQHRAMRETVDEVARAAAAEGIDADLAKGGTIVLARSRAQLRRARREVAEARTWDRDEDDLRLLGKAEAQAVLRGTRTVGATYTPDCAAIHPAKLVRGLADAVERRGVTIHERTRVHAIAPGRAHTADGDVRARTVIRATEGYTATLAGHERAMIPVYSLVIATEPLSASTWDEIGLARRETFSDHRHLIVYGQRTADDRLVFGGRGAPYHFGSRTNPEFDQDQKVFARLYATLIDLFPALEGGTRVTHAWGGALGIPRDWCASVGLDRETGVGWAGGYVGDGVSTTNLAGRTLRDLVLERDTELTRLPWVGHRSPAWEREPLRWLGINAGLRAMTLADAEESVTRLPSLAAKVVSPLLG